MTDRPTNDRPTMTTDADLEAALLDLAGTLAPVTAPDLAASVRHRVERLGAPAPGLRRRLGGLLGRPGPVGPTRVRPLRRALVLALVALLILAGLAAAIGFGLPGLRIVFLGPGSTVTPSAPASAAPPSSPGPGVSPPATVPATSTALPSPSSSSIDAIGLGRRVDPSGLDAAAGRHVALPTDPELRDPVGAFIRGTPPGALVSVAYGATSSLPAGPSAPHAGSSPVAILIMALPGATDGGYLQKLLPEGTTVQSVRVDGHPGFWIAGQPHELLYVAPDGRVTKESVRLVGDVLAWNDGDLTYRIEGAPDLATALRLAASMR